MGTRLWHNSCWPAVGYGDGGIGGGGLRQQGAGAARPVELAAGAAGLRLVTSPVAELGGGGQGGHLLPTPDGCFFFGSRLA